MRAKALLSWAGVFSMVAAVSGGCDEREETPVQRMPRVAESTAELFALDDAGTSREPSDWRELVGDLTPPAVIETVRPSPQLPRARKRAEVPPKAEVAVEESSRPVPEPPKTTAPSPVELRVPPPAQVETGPRWQTVPSPRGAHETAIQVSVAIGLGSIGVGSAAAMGDGTGGERVIAIGALGLGIASFTTAFVLYLTEPDPAKPSKQVAKPTANVTLAPGALGVRGTF